MVLLHAGEAVLMRRLKCRSEINTLVTENLNTHTHTLSLALNMPPNTQRPDYVTFKCNIYENHHEIKLPVSVESILHLFFDDSSENKMHDKVRA